MAKGTIQGRLNREPNPMPGEKPGFTPQYINDDGYAVDVTPETPYPVGNYVIKNGVWVPWDGSTQLTGSIIENDSIKTSITKNNSVRELLANTVVPAGGYVVVSAEFNGSRVGFGIRWEQTIPFRIRFQYEHLNTAVSEQITLVSRTHSRADGNIDLNLAKGSFIIWNDSQQDVIIRFFVISDFMGGSKNANSDQQFA